MAQQTQRLASWRDDMVIASITYNDANNNVMEITVDNRSWGPITFAVWLNADPLQRLLVTVLPNNPSPSVYSNFPAGTKYSPVELPIGDPKQTNFSYSYVG